MSLRQPNFCGKFVEITVLVYLQTKIFYVKQFHYFLFGMCAYNSHSVCVTQWGNFPVKKQVTQKKRNTSIIIYANSTFFTYLKRKMNNDVFETFSEELIDHFILKYAEISLKFNQSNK